MEQITNEQPADATAVDVLAAVAGDNPQGARGVLESTSFRDRALLEAWFEEAARLVREAQRQYETRERRAWQASPRPLAADEPARLRDVVREHLRTRLTAGRDWTDLRDIVLAVAPYTDAGNEAIGEWAKEHIRDLVQHGVLSPTPAFEGTEIEEYRIVAAPGQDKSGSTPTG